MSCIAQSLKPLNKNLILIKASNNRTYENRKFGFILDVDQANISEAYYSNTGSGYGKIWQHLKQYYSKQTIMLEPM